MKKPSFGNIDLQALADDFRNLNPQDVGAWPVAPRVAVLIGVFIVAMVAGWWFLWSDQFDLLALRQQEESKLKEEFVAKKT